MQIQGRSYARGEVTLDELRAVTSGFEHAHALVAEDLLSADYDAILVEGDLHLPSLSLGDGVVLLVVTGNLTVDGACNDCDDPATGLYVLGNLQAGSVYTAGMMGVQGNLTVTRTLAGFYNDYYATVKGTTRAAVFFPENHSFVFVGEPSFDHVLGENAKYRVSKQWSGLMEETLLGRALMERSPCAPGEEVDDLSPEEIETYGAAMLLSARSLYRRVRADEPVLHD